MHELSLSLNILDLVERSVDKEKFRQVCEVRIEVGMLSGVDAGNLEEMLKMVAATTDYSKVRWVMTQKGASGFCENCCLQFPMTYLWDVCPRCGRRAGKITEGDDVEVSSIIVLE